jgi:hypothetical protein
VPQYAEAILNRIGFLDEELAEHPSRHRLLSYDPVPLRRSILDDAALKRRGKNEAG